jgi:large subunit ribosomal protein L17
MVTSLLKQEQIETTEAKAKAVRPVAERLITLAKRGDLHARRQALQFIQEKAVAHRLFDELKDRYAGRQGGYLRIVKKGTRKGDGAAVSVLQLLPADEAKKDVKRRAKGKRAAKAPGSRPKKKAPGKKESEKAAEKQ